MTENNFLTANMVANFGTISLCTFLMLATNLNMLPAIYLCLAYSFFDKEPFTRMASQLVDRHKSRPTRFQFVVSFMVAFYATISTVFLHYSSRLLCWLINMSRSLTIEQNVRNMVYKCGTQSILFLSNRMVDKATALVTFGTIMWFVYILLNTFAHYGSAKNAKAKNAKAAGKFPFVDCPLMRLGCNVIFSDCDQLVHVLDNPSAKVHAHDNPSVLQAIPEELLDTKTNTETCMGRDPHTTQILNSPISDIPCCTPIKQDCCTNSTVKQCSFTSTVKQDCSTNSTVKQELKDSIMDTLSGPAVKPIRDYGHSFISKVVAQDPTKEISYLDLAETPKKQNTLQNCKQTSDSCVAKQLTNGFCFVSTLEKEPEMNNPQDQAKKND